MEADTRYAKSGNVYIAYRVFGSGRATSSSCLAPSLTAHGAALFDAYVAKTRILQGSHLDITGLSKGKHLFQCCIHPWMRMEVDVK